MILLQILLLAQQGLGTIMPIIRSWRVLYRRLLPVVFGALVFKLSVCCGAEGLCVRFAGCKAPNSTGSNLLYNTLELLMMGIMVLETCWASNKICNKNHLLHLVGILFPRINDDARSKSLKIYQEHVLQQKIYCYLQQKHCNSVQFNYISCLIQLFFELKLA